MKKLMFSIAFLWIFGVSICFAADTSKSEVRISVDDGTTIVMDSGKITSTFSSGTRQQQTISLDAARATAITVPSGARLVLFDLNNVRDLSLVGTAGDVGISLDSNAPLLLPLSRDSVTIRISNDNATAQTIRAYWL